MYFTFIFERIYKEAPLEQFIGDLFDEEMTIWVRKTMDFIALTSSILIVSRLFRQMLLFPVWVKFVKLER